MRGAESQSGRFAFLLGNAAYTHLTPLRNPANDIAAVARQLRSLGYDVSDHANLDWNNTCHRVGEFAKKAGRCEAIVVYYSGHGVQLNGKNYIVPVDFDPSTPVDLDAEAGLVPVETVMGAVGLADARLIFLDACRDDGGLSRARVRERIEPAAPARAASREGGAQTRSLVAGQGLAKQKLGKEQTFICFAADPGDVARDGEGAMSPFSEAVTAHIGLRGLDAFDFSQRVARDVRTATGGQQVPWTNSNLSKGFSFNPADDRPMWILIALGGIAGLLSALTSLNVVAQWWPLVLTDRLKLHDVSAHPQYLLTSLFFGAVLGFGAYWWGRREWHVPLFTCLLYFLMASFSRLWFAPYGAREKTQERLANIKFSDIIGAVPTSCDDRELLYAILFAASVIGLGSVLSAAPWVRDLAKMTRIAAGAACGVAAIAFLLIFLKSRDDLNAVLTRFHSGSEGNAEFYWLEPLGVLVLFVLWHMLLAYNVGRAYARPTYD